MARWTPEDGGYVGFPPQAWPEPRYKMERNADGTANVLKRCANGYYETIFHNRNVGEMAQYVGQMNNGLQPWD